MFSLDRLRCSNYEFVLLSTGRKLGKTVLNESETYNADSHRSSSQLVKHGKLYSYSRLKKQGTENIPSKINFPPIFFSWNAMHRFSEGKKEERFTFQVHRIWCCIILLLWAVTLQALHKAMQQFLAGLLATQQNTDCHRRERKSNGKNPTFFWISIIIIMDTQSIHTLGTKVADTSLSTYWFSVLLTPVNLLIQCVANSRQLTDSVCC